MRKYIDYLNGVLVLLMSLTIIVQILARLVIKVPTSWSVETGIILFVFVVFLGIASIMREGSHLKVDTIVELLPKPMRKILNIAGGFLILAFSIVLAVGAGRSVVSNWQVEIPTIEWFKWGYVYLVILAATLITMYYQILNIVDEIRGVKDK